MLVDVLSVVRGNKRRAFGRAASWSTRQHCKAFVSFPVISKLSLKNWVSEEMKEPLCRCIVFGGAFRLRLGCWYNVHFSVFRKCDNT